jgi:hypothetical protein
MSRRYGSARRAAPPGDAGRDYPLAWESLHNLLRRRRRGSASADHDLERPGRVHALELDPTLPSNELIRRVLRAG